MYQLVIEITDSGIYYDFSAIYLDSVSKAARYVCVEGIPEGCHQAIY